MERSMRIRRMSSERVTAGVESCVASRMCLAYRGLAIGGGHDTETNATHEKQQIEKPPTVGTGHSNAWQGYQSAEGGFSVAASFRVWFFADHEMFLPRFGGLGFPSRGVAVFGGGFGGDCGVSVDRVGGAGGFGGDSLCGAGVFDSRGCDEGFYLGIGALVENS